MNTVKNINIDIDDVLKKIINYAEGESDLYKMNFYGELAQKLIIEERVLRAKFAREHNKNNAQ